jgi:putative hemolysin
LVTEILIILLLLLVNAFFAASEMALISLNDNKIKMMAEQGDKKAKLIHRMLSEPSKFLATIQIGITLAGFLSSAFASESFSDRLVYLIQKTNIPIPGPTLKTLSVFIISLILSYFSLVLGELVPKRLAMKKAESMSMLSIRPLKILNKILGPFVNFLTVSTNAVVRLFGVDPNSKEDGVTEEEIRMMVDVGEEKGVIQETEKLMINNIFEFDNKAVSEIMTHRTEIVGISKDASFKEVMDVVNCELYTRFPVYEESIDNIIGILHTKDLFKYVGGASTEGFNLDKLIRHPYFVPSSKKIDELFVEIKKMKSHMAVVIDEYGGTAGLVTLEDLVEEIVGNIFDEYDEEEKEIETIDETSYRINGSMDLDRVHEYLDIEMPDDEYETLSGFLIGQLGRIPTKGEKPEIEYGGYIFKVEQIDEKRITSVSAMKVLNENEEEL